ncbi:BTAD domain-containing putative transcriptional regulator [Microbacterium sp. NPDC079995]|uniref:BTAD domain-containing putative transcriptional regulator n=1 Tax=unclassified Microbacterium TaxID=2609290 RepID=UPI00344B4740
MDLEIDLLGPLHVRADGRDVPLGGDHPQAILARLATTPGEPVPTHELIASVWTDPPAAVVSTLRAHISRMRLGGLRDVIVGERGGYLLDASVDDVDLLRWRHAVTQPSTDDAARLRTLIAATAALARTPLPGLKHHPHVKRLQREVADERAFLEEELGDLALRLGDVGLATAVLSETTTRHPLRERPVRTLAMALARAGRMSDAVAVIDALRDRLQEHGGIRLSSRLEELRAAVIRFDPAVVSPLAAPAPAVRRVGIAIPLTRFVGRSVDLARLARLGHTDRLVTLVGPAGVGKTRLAVEAARRSGVDREQYMVDLADIAEPDGVIGAIATVVRAPETSVDAIVRRLHGAGALLLLDNADLVIGALSVVIDAILADPDGARVVVTSREALRAPGERTVVIRPLAGDHADEAWQLFEQRAVDARGGRPFTEDEQLPARALCDSLDGLPLAIELATARLDVLGIEEVRAGLGAVPGPPGRHSSLQSAIGWTVALLDSADSAGLHAVARFAGPFTVEAVAGIMRMRLAEADALVDRLVSRSLVAADRTATGRRRFRVLEAMKEVLTPEDDPELAAAWHEAHRRWFSDLAYSTAPTLRAFEGRDTAAILDGFQADLDLAHAHNLVVGDRLGAVRLAGGLAHHRYLRGRLAEGRRWIDEALALSGESDAGADALANIELANLAYQLGDAPAAFTAIADALRLAIAADDASVQMVALSRAGYGRSLFGDVETGAGLLAQAATLHERAAPWAVSEYRMSHGQVLRAQGRLDEALRELTEAHRVAASIGYTWMVTSASYVMVKTLIDARRPRDAVAVGRTAVLTARADEDAAGALAVLHALAAAAAAVERHEEGAMLLGAVDELGLRYDYSTMTAEGEDAARLRAVVSAGLRADEFTRAVTAGRRMDWDAVVAIIDRLPGVGPAVSMSGG